MMRLAVLPVLGFALVAGLQAGRPIILDEPEACTGAELVIIARVAPPKEVPEDDEGFLGSRWHQFGMTHVSEVTVKRVLMGKAPKRLRLYGGQLAGGTAYRLEGGEFLLLLSKLEGGAYRAVDWHYSFAPVRKGKVGWLVDRPEGTREWMAPGEVARRIEFHRKAARQDDDRVDP